MLRVVLDTNVLVSAMISTKSAPALLLDAAGENYALFVSLDILEEFKGVISRDKFGFSDEEISTIMEAIISVSEIVNPEIKIDVIKSDPDDNKIPECAITCGDSYIVSGDKRLLELGEYRSISIINPREAIDLLNIKLNER